MAHPHRIAAADVPEAVEQRAGFQDFDICTPKFRSVAALDRTAQLRAQSLLAVTDGKDRQAAVEHYLRRAWRTLGHDRRGAARQYNALGLHSRECLCGSVEWGNFRIDPGLAHAAGDKLGDLATKVDDEDGIAGLSAFVSFWHGQPIGIAAAAVHIGAAAAAN